MSSFFGHSVAAITVYVATESMTSSRSLFHRYKHFLNHRKQFLWVLWLIVVASIPDLDYVVEAWQYSNNQGLRITHSILFSSIAPSLTIGVLFALGIKGKKLFLRSLQVILVGLSHLILDFSVGVTALPLLFPAIDIPFKLPFGILPSAGKIDLNNYYFYRNLKLEMGVLLPIFSLVVLWRDRDYSKYPQAKNVIKIFIYTLLLLCCAYFIHLNLALPR